jgi:hypothetical protein
VVLKPPARLLRQSPSGRVWLVAGLVALALIGSVAGFVLSSFAAR